MKIRHQSRQIVLRIMLGDFLVVYYNELELDSRDLIPKFVKFLFITVFGSLVTSL